MSTRLELYFYCKGLVKQMTDKVWCFPIYVQILETKAVWKIQTAFVILNKSVIWLSTYFSPLLSLFIQTALISTLF